MTVKCLRQRRPNASMWHDYGLHGCTGNLRYRATARYAAAAEMARSLTRQTCLKRAATHRPFRAASTRTLTAWGAHPSPGQIASTLPIPSSGIEQGFCDWQVTHVGVREYAPCAGELGKGTALDDAVSGRKMH
jgi:hypothetical protein